MNFHCPHFNGTVGPVWIIGDSIIRWAAGSFALPRHVVWKGKSGARMGDLDLLLKSIKGPTPSVIIFHIGTNDLVDVDEFCMRQRITVSLQTYVSQFSTTKVVWSDILPRIFYFGAKSQAAVEKKRRAINRWAKSQCIRLGAHCLPHPQFVWSETALYRFDGVHLSPLGTKIFRDNLRACASAMLVN